MTSDLAFGIREGDRPGAERIGRRVEELGYCELWANDSGGHTGVATLDDSSRDTSRIDLALGVIPLHRFTIEEIVGQLSRSRLPADRLTVGIGAGLGIGLAGVRDGVEKLRVARPDVRVAVAAVGPKMCQLGGELADVVLLSWSTPERIEWARERIVEGARAAGRDVPRIVGYVRVAPGADAEERIRTEMGKYQKAPHYQKAFGEQKVEIIGVALETLDPDLLAEQLAPYREVLDTTVVRGLPATDDVDAWLAIAEAGAPRD